MTGERDGLLEGWADQRRRLGILEAQLILAVDLLIEALDQLDAHRHPALHTAIRTFLLNTPVGGR